MRYHYTSVTAQIQNTDNTKCWRGCGATGLLFVGDGNAKWCSTLEGSLAVSYKTLHTLTIWSCSCAPWCLPKWTENLFPSKNLHANVYSNFTHNYPNLEATKMALVASILTMEYYLAVERNKLLSHEKTWNLKCNLWCKLLNEGNLKRYILYDSKHMTFQRKRNYGNSKIGGCPGIWREGGRAGWIGGVWGVFRAVKLFCMIL